MEKCVYCDLSEDTVSGSACKFRLQARLLEAFTNESVSLPCKIKLFRYAPAKLDFWQILLYIIHTLCLYGEAKWPQWAWRCLATGNSDWYAVVSRPCNDPPSVFGSFIIYSWALLLPIQKVKKIIPQSHARPGLPSVPMVFAAVLVWELLDRGPLGMASSAANLIEPIYSFK